MNLSAMNRFKKYNVLDVHICVKGCSQMRENKLMGKNCFNPHSQIIVIYSMNTNFHGFRCWVDSQNFMFNCDFHLIHKS